MGDGDDVRGCVGEEARLGRNVLSRMGIGMSGRGQTDGQGEILA